MGEENAATSGEPPLNQTYLSQTYRDQSNIFEKMTDIFLGSIVNHIDLPDLSVVGDGQVSDVLLDIAEKNSPIFGTVAFGLFLALLMPVLGVICCCCRCGGRKVDVKSSGPVRTRVYSFGLFVSIIFAFFGSVWVFVGNSNVKHGVMMIPKVVDDILNDYEHFVFNTNVELNHTFVSNLNTAKKEFEGQLSQQDKIADEIVYNITDQLNISTSFKILDNIQRWQTLYKINEIKIKQLKQIVTELTDSVQKVSPQLSEVKKRPCITENDACQILKQLKEEIDSILVVLINETFTQSFPNFNEQSFTEFNSLESNIQSMNETLHKTVRNNIKKFTKESITVIDALAMTSDKSEEIPQKMKELGENIKAVTNLLQFLPTKDEIKNKHLKSYIETSSDYAEHYFWYLDYSLMGVGGAMIMILIIFSLTLLKGSTALPGRQSSPSLSNFNQSTSFLVAMFGFILAACMFLVGSIAENAVCKSFEDPKNSEIINFANKPFKDWMNQFISGLKHEEVSMEWNIADIVNDFHQDHTIYHVFKLERVYNIGDFYDRKIFEKNGDVIKTAEKTVINEVYKWKDILKDIQSDKELLKKIARQIDNLHLFLRDIKETNLKHFHNFYALFKSLSSTQIHLSEEIKQHLNDINEQIVVINHSLNNLTLIEEIALSNTTGEVLDVLDDIRNLQENLDNDGIDKVVEKILHGILGKFTRVIDTFVEHIVESVEEKIGACGPLSGMWNSTHVGLCNYVIDPFNSVWSGLGWTLLFILLPISIISCKLQNLYHTNMIEEANKPKSFRSHGVDNYAMADHILYNENYEEYSSSQI